MDILKRLEQKGYKLVGIKVLVPSKELASKHYAGELPQHWAHCRCILALAAVVASKVAAARTCCLSGGRDKETLGWVHQGLLQTTPPHTEAESVRRPAEICSGLPPHQQQRGQPA